MSTVHRDIYKTEVTHDVIHAYTDSGIAQLLSDVYKLANDAQWRGDVEAIVLRVDLERALRSRCMSPKQRQAVALYYFAQLTQEECAKVLGVTKRSVRVRLENALSNIARHMSGEYVDSTQTIDKSDHVQHERLWLHMWLDGVLHNVSDWWNFGDTFDDAIMNEALRDLNRLLGAPKPDDTTELTSSCEITTYTEQQMKRKFKREISRPQVYPVFDNTGSIVNESGSRDAILYKPRHA